MSRWTRLWETLLHRDAYVRRQAVARRLAEEQMRRVDQEAEALAEQVQQLRGDLADCQMRAEVDAATLRHIRRLAAEPLTAAQFRARVDAALAGEPEGGDRG